MEQYETKTCPFCAEQIRKQAIKCRYCGSSLDKKDFNLNFLSTPGYWHRVNKGKKVAGVCTGIARQLDSPILILPLRLFFILTTIFYGFGVLLYIILWILMPAPTDNTALGDQGTRYASRPKPEPSPPADENRQPESPADNDNRETGKNGDNEEPPAAAAAADSIPAAEQPVAAGTPEQQVSPATAEAEGEIEIEDSNEGGSDSGEKNGEWKVEMSSLNPGFLLSLGTVMLLAALSYLFVLKLFVGIGVSTFSMIAIITLALLPLMGTLAAVRTGNERIVSAQAV